MVIAKVACQSKKSILHEACTSVPRNASSNTSTVKFYICLIVPQFEITAPKLTYFTLVPELDGLEGNPDSFPALSSPFVAHKTAKKQQIITFIILF